MSGLRQREPRFESEAWKQACRDADHCYLRLDGCQFYPVMPCHSNQLSDGKGMGLKTHDVLTVPGCLHCHTKLDHGNDMPRADKQLAFNAAWKRWIVDLARSGKLTIHS